MRRTEPEFDGAGGDEAAAGGVDDGEFAGSEDEGDGLGGVCYEMDALEADERADGSAVQVRVGDVKFDDLIARDRGGVGDGGGDLDEASAGNRFFRAYRPVSRGA